MNPISFFAWPKQHVNKIKKIVTSNYRSCHGLKSLLFFCSIKRKSSWIRRISHPELIKVILLQDLAVSYREILEVSSAIVWDFLKFEGKFSNLTITKGETLPTRKIIIVRAQSPNYSSNQKLNFVFSESFTSFLNCFILFYICLVPARNFQHNCFRPQYNFTRRLWKSFGKRTCKLPRAKNKSYVVRYKYKRQKKLGTYYVLYFLFKFNKSMQYNIFWSSNE